jgi:2-polyprenyl-3-methyl-5-hydroxy-6-metoxy-1,4-benzoquinol methylase
MDDREQREMIFHDQIYENQDRKKVGKYYSVTASSRRYYISLLVRECNGKKILECGCGESSMALLLAQSGALVTGIDISSVAIEHAKQEADKQSNISSIFHHGCGEHRFRRSII